MNRERLDQFCERALLALTLLILVFGPLALGAARDQDFLVLQALVALSGLVWLVRLWLQERPQVLWPPVCWFVLAFTVYAAARWLTADLEYVARLEFTRVVCYALVFLVVLNNLHRQESIRIITLTLTGLAAAIAAYALAQFLTGNYHVWTFAGSYPGRGTGTYICPNHLAGFLELVLPLTLARVIVSRSKLWLKILLGYAALVMVAGHLVSLSRGGWLACGASLTVLSLVLLFRRSLRWRAVLAVLALAAAVGVIALQSPKVYYRFHRIIGPEAQNRHQEDIRYQFWRPAVEIWREHPWFGAGPGSFEYRFFLYRPVAVQFRPDRVHNDYLNTLADWGAVGLALVLGAVACVGVGAAQTWPFVRGGGRDLGDNRSDKFAFLIGALTALLALLLHSVVDFNMQIPANAILVVTLLALVTAQLRFATEKYWFRPGVAARLALTLGVLVLAGFLVAQGTRRAHEFFAQQAVLRTALGSPAQLAALKRCYALEPKNPQTAFQLGDGLRLRSMDGNRNFAALGAESLEWLDRSLALNPYEALTWVRRGMVLDWLERHDEAGAAFAHAAALDPNGSYAIAFLGWHQVQLGDYAAARECFARSWQANFWDNPTADEYLTLIDRRLREAAEGPALPVPQRRSPGEVKIEPFR